VSEREPNLGDERVPDVHQPDAFTPTTPVLQIVVEPDSQLAFHDFYAGCRDRVGRALAVTLHDTDLAADSVDEAMARAYQRWSSVSTLENPAGWVYRVGLNVARSRIRRVARRARLPRPDDRMPEPALIEPAVLRALGELPVDQRSVVVCRLLLGWSEAETAAALGIRPGTAKSRLHRALSALEPKLAHFRTEGRS
jgi:RNA polymerase sigma-70 factor (ECF subfamily)